MNFQIRYYIESNKFFSQIIVTERNTINMINMVRITENSLLLRSDEPVPGKGKKIKPYKIIFFCIGGVGFFSSVSIFENVCKMSPNL